MKATPETGHSWPLPPSIAFEPEAPLEPLVVTQGPLRHSAILQFTPCSRILPHPFVSHPAQLLALRCESYAQVTQTVRRLRTRPPSYSPTDVVHSAHSLHVRH